MKKHLYLILLIGLFSCKKGVKKSELIIVEKPKIIQKFGYIFNNYKVIEDTVKKNETFGSLLDKNHVENPLINKIVVNTKKTFDIARQLRVGKPYTILVSKDSLEKAQVFIYEPNKVEYVVFDFKDSISAYIGRKEIKTILKSASGEITTNLSNAIDEQGLNYNVTYALSDIYAWTIDFFHLQKGDKFKVIYEEKFINDTLSIGIGEIKAAYFEHNKKSFYAFKYMSDSVSNIPEYYDEKANNLRRTFLKAPLKFSNRISSRYNLKRRIKHYGNKIKAHKGTDFPSPIGTPIISTANGKVVKSAYKRRGNGNFVKIKHSNTYSTQYLHMKKRKVKVGDYVKQGDVIGWIGMTGSTSGPHVCYRFWKNGKQVDPFRQKLPSVELMKKEVKPKYLEFIKSIKAEVDSIKFFESKIDEIPIMYSKVNTKKN
ncbi:MAG: peptidoglycan DD-metalloendopeptidase family protein [Flavobacteriaceae bacterium]|nr:peptidoglycan DD-metalloendopeptidase family protein [Flavobacteriaceae bacterium]